MSGWWLRFYFRWKMLVLNYFGCLMKVLDRRFLDRWFYSRGKVRVRLVIGI